MRDHVVIEQLEISLTEVAIAAPPNRILGERVDDNVFVLRAAAGMDAGLGAEGAALHERAFTISHRVLHQNGVGQIPMSAGEILETELIGAIRAVPHTRFYHLKPPLWPLGAAASRLLACRLDRRFSWRFLAPQGAAPSGRPLCTNPPRRQALRPYIQPLRVCQAESSQSLTGVFQRCSAARSSGGKSGELSTSARPFRQIGQNFAQLPRSCDALWKFQAEHGITAAKVQSAWIEPDHPPPPRWST